MKRTKLQSRNGEKGFTLVELAIVMIIIGLLITGILKGQEMIANAQVSSTITQVKAIEAATSTFRDIYNAFPGDMITAEDRLIGCVNPDCANGSGDNRINVGMGAALNNNESAQFFVHMLLADLISGSQSSGNAVYGELFPAAPIGGGFTIGHSIEAVAAGLTEANVRAGHYLTLDGSVLAAGEDTGVVNTTQAERMDRKLDDGIGVTGSVQAIGDGCIDAANDQYDFTAQDALCVMFFRIQG